jgi:thioredoxin reductase
MAFLFRALFFLVALLSLCVAKKVPIVEYDVIIIGAGPAGLSAASGLCRVARKVIVFDTEEYRNGPTRNMHDVIGNDGEQSPHNYNISCPELTIARPGTRPADFRAAARAQIQKYNTATMKKAKVVEITPIKNPDGYDWFVVRDDAGLPYTARRIILATGVKDILPSTPGTLDAFGKGMYWCPWCDGYEHREQSLGVVGPLSDALSASLEMHNMNPDIIVMTNGTDTIEQRAIATERSATWQEQFAAYNISIVNTTIASFTRLRDENGRPVAQRTSDQAQSILAPENEEFHSTADNWGPNGKHKDLFRVTFADGLSVERAAFLINIETKQTSHLAAHLNLNMTKSKIAVDAKMQTNVTGIFAVGDANDDGSTNVPHAMYTGKKAAVVSHGESRRSSIMFWESFTNVDCSATCEGGVVSVTIQEELWRSRCRKPRGIG